MSAQALVFHIIHGSFVDGFGIRTTVFLKGCPLKCIWCCNPEGQSFLPELKVTREHCNGCGNCIPACPRGAMSLAGGTVRVNRGLCDGCMKCVDVCYAGALEPFGTKYTAQEVFEIIRSDEMFYKSSGGGVTIGGGECTCYPDFMMELIALCHGADIHVAVDTCGYTTSAKAKEVLKAADLLLFDIKGIDPARHMENTGKSNDVILENLRMLSDLRKPMIIRIPVIPGYNDSDENLNAVADLLSTLNSVERVDILPEHEFGRIKYEQLDMEYRLKPCPVSAERQEAIRAMFESRGFKAQLGG